MIFVVTIALLGKARVDANDKPTSEINHYVQADSAADVPTLAQKWCNEKGLPFGYVKYQNRAVFQELSKYTEPASIIGVSA